MVQRVGLDRHDHGDGVGQWSRRGGLCAGQRASRIERFVLGRRRLRSGRRRRWVHAGHRNGRLDAALLEQQLSGRRLVHGPRSGRRRSRQYRSQPDGDFHLRQHRASPDPGHAGQRQRDEFAADIQRHGRDPGRGFDHDRREHLFRARRGRRTGASPRGDSQSGRQLLDLREPCIDGRAIYRSGSAERFGRQYRFQCPADLYGRRRSSHRDKRNPQRHADFGRGRSGSVHVDGDFQ